MKAPLFLVLGAAALLAACADTSSEPSMQYRQTPFRQLPGIDLGMTAQRVHELRPNIKYTPFLGVQERMGEYIVSYQFPSSMDDKAQGVDPNDHLGGVIITEMFASPEQAEAGWRAKVVASSSDLGSPTACESVVGGGKQARWVSGKTVFAIGVFPRETAAMNVGDRVLYVLTPLAAFKQLPGATAIQCP